MGKLAPDPSPGRGPEFILRIRAPTHSHVLPTWLTILGEILKYFSMGSGALGEIHQNIIVGGAQKAQGHADLPLGGCHIQADETYQNGFVKLVQK